ncbi:MAG: hypothetical protein ACI4NV_02295 [Thermoguttaceae bacterium]
MIRSDFTFAAILAAFLAIALQGCAALSGYNVGPRGLYNGNVRTVYVQMVDADTYRQGFGERITEAVCKKITEQTPYRIATVGEADSLLAIKLHSETQSVNARDRFNGTREKNIRLTATAVWKVLDSSNLSESGLTPVSMNDGVTLESSAYLVPEVGQSSATSQQEAIDKLADEIVGLMETPW